jgi:hypothetical protein
MITLSKWTIIVIGLFFISVGMIMLFKPNLARSILKKAGRTNFINYAEITIRMIPDRALIFYSNLSKCQTILMVLGWFMLITSLILYFVPRKIHHSYSLRCADILKPIYFQIISPFSIFIGIAIIWCVY